MSMFRKQKCKNRLEWEYLCGQIEGEHSSKACKLSTAMSLFWFSVAAITNSYKCSGWNHSFINFQFSRSEVHEDSGSRFHKTQIKVLVSLSSYMEVLGKSLLPGHSWRNSHFLVVLGLRSLSTLPISWRSFLAFMGILCTELYLHGCH